MAELRPSQLKRYRTLLGNYHVELENLIRTLEALEQAGLKLAYTVKGVTKVHDRLERFLERIESGEFNARDASTIAALLNEGIWSGYESDNAFERTTGRAVQQMEKTRKRHEQLYDWVFSDESADEDLPELSEAELTAISEEADEESED